MSESSITTAAGVARALGVSERTVHRWFGAGCPRANGDGVYDLVGIKNWRDVNIGRPDDDDGLGPPCLECGACARTGEAIIREPGYAKEAAENREFQGLAALVIERLAERVLKRVPQKQWRCPAERLGSILKKESATAVREFHQLFCYWQSSDYWVVREILDGEDHPVDENTPEVEFEKLLTERIAGEEAATN